MALAVEVVGLMMLLRIRAIYSGRSRFWITSLLSTILLIETGINAWLISHSHRMCTFPSSESPGSYHSFLQRLFTIHILGSPVSPPLSHRNGASFTKNMNFRTACSVVFDTTQPGIKILGPSSAWIPLTYDTIIFGLTMYKTIPPLRNAPNASTIIHRLFEDGFLYYR